MSRRINSFKSKKQQQKLLDFVGFSSIQEFRSENPEFNSNDKAFKFLMTGYNNEVDFYADQERQRKNDQKEYSKSIITSVNKNMNKPSLVSIPVDFQRSGGLKNILKKLKIGSKRLYISSGNKIFMLNSQSLARLDALIENPYEYTAEEYESGKEIIRAIQEYGEFRININPETSGRGLIEGAFFPYTHNLFIDLEKYAIFHSNTDFGANNNKYNCFINALEVAGYSVEKVLQYVKNQYIPVRMFKEIANLLNIYIVVKTPKSNHGQRKYGNPKNPVLRLGLIEKHYFLIEPTIYTKFCIENYFKEIDGKPLYLYNNFNDISGIRDGKIVRDSREDHKIDSFRLIELLVENKNTHLKELTGVNVYKLFNYRNIEEEIFKNLEYNDTIYQKVFNEETGKIETLNPDGELCYNERNKIKEYDEGEEPIVIYFDFETTTTKEDGTETIHKPYLMCDNHTKDRIGYIGEDCGKQFLDNYCSQYGTKNKKGQEPQKQRKLIFIAHNAGYDFRFLVLYLYSYETIERGNGLMYGNCIYYNSKGRKLEFEVRDSLKMINMKLEKFSETFGLKEYKEIMPYALYTEENVKRRYIDKETCLSFINKEEDKKQFLDNCKKWKCIIGTSYEYCSYTELGVPIKKGLIDIILYSKNYCDMDCLTLKAGYEKFRELVKTALGLDILNYVSLASMSHDYLIKTGCYDGVLKICGIVRAFIQRCIVGGRTMCNSNEKNILENVKVADFDAVSLYPSGMVRMDGFLIGKAKIIETFEPEKYSGYFICIRIKKINRKLQFPLCSYINDKGVRIFTNELEDRIVYIDKVGLEDLIKYQGVEYQFINGYYYDEGHNSKIKEVMAFLFTQRLKYKKDKNPLQLVFKECMNSCYGKSYLKPIDTDIEYVKAKDMEEFISRKYNHIKEATILENEKHIKATLFKPINRHFNNAHIGVEILSITKRIMNEVMVLADNLGIKIYYQDTDSMHVDCDNIPLLAEKFKENYGRELIGKGMGQFHTDFDLEGAVGDIYATDCIFLGKKCYVDVLKSVDKEGNEITGHHIRMKGVPDDSIIFKANEDFDGDVFKLYKHLYDGYEVAFNLLATKPKFEFKSNMTIQSKKEFIRNISFVDEETKKSLKKNKAKK